MQSYLFIDLVLIVGGAIMAVALLHVALAVRGVRPRLNWIFAILSFFAAGEGLSAPLRYLSTTVGGALNGIRLGQGSMLALGLMLVWFAREFAGLKGRRIPIGLTAFGLVVLALHLSLPNTLRYSDVTGLKTSPLPGGGSMYTPVGTIHPLLGLAHAVGALCIIYICAAGIHLWRRRECRRKAIAFTVGVAPTVFLAYPHGILVSRAIVDPPQYYAFAFLGLVAVFSHNLIGDAVRSAALSREIRSNEERWRSLLKGVPLLVLGCDTEGKIEYANPHAITVTGHEPETLIGKRFDMLCAPPELASINSNFSKAMAGVPPPQLQTRLVTRSNQIRHVLWSTVLLRGHDGQPSGTICVGADITDRVLAEAGRDQAMSQLAVLKADLEAENEYLKMELATSVDAPDVIGKSDGIRYVLHKVAQVAGTQATVLIEGETGVGKELVARAIHRSSPRAQMPFIRVNCAALPPSLVESELFGHERGAFTGADRQRQGRFEMADGGTILLDEIGEISLDIQAKLLRVLQEGEFDRVGGVKTRKTDVRVIASTNRDLRQDVAQGRFREDLYYRLQVFPISVPPLRDRRDDIPLLVQAFVQRICQKHGKPVLEVSMKTIRQLSERDWPGNIRELENVIERAVITNSGSVLNLSEESGRGGQPLMNGAAAQSLTLDEVERNHIEQVLRRTGGQIAGEGGAAQILGLHPNTLRGRMAKLGVARPKSAEKAASA